MTWYSWDVNQGYNLQLQAGCLPITRQVPGLLQAEPRCQELLGFLLCAAAQAIEPSFTVLGTLAGS